MRFGGRSTGSGVAVKSVTDDGTWIGMYAPLLILYWSVFRFFKWTMQTLISFGSTPGVKKIERFVIVWSDDGRFDANRGVIANPVYIPRDSKVTRFGGRCSGITMKNWRADLIDKWVIVLGILLIVSELISSQLITNFVNFGGSFDISLASIPPALSIKEQISVSNSRGNLSKSIIRLG